MRIAGMSPADEPRSAPYFNRRDQYRMLAMVGLLCLVMAAIQLAAKPSSWYWLLPPGNERSTSSDQAASDTKTLRELDFRVRGALDDPLRPDEFRAIAAEEKQSSVVEPQDRLEPPAAVRKEIEIPDDLLNSIEDNTIGVRKVETEAYLHLLDVARRLSPSDLDRFAVDDVAFTVIMLQPAGYRGKLIQITGQLRRLTEIPVPPNSKGIEQLYEGWLFTNDSGNNPWRFLCNSIPAGTALGTEIDPVRAEVTGFFFKRTGYASNGGQHVAPTLLAHTFEIAPIPMSVAPQMQTQMRTWMLGFIGTVLVAVTLLVCWYVRADRKFARSHLRQLAASRLDADSGDLAALGDLDLPDSTRIFAEGVDVPERDPREA